MKKRLNIKKGVKDIILETLYVYDDNYMSKDTHPPSFSVKNGVLTYLTHTKSGKYVISDTDITFEGLNASFRDATPFWNNKLLELFSDGVWEDVLDSPTLSEENVALCDTIINYVTENELVNIWPVISNWQQKTEAMAEQYSCSPNDYAIFKIDLSEFIGHGYLDVTKERITIKERGSDLFV